MKTKIHYYRFSGSSDPAYKSMVETIKANSEGRGHWMNAWGGKYKPQPDGTQEITIETDHLFGNQWNSDVGRVFDWYEEYMDSHWKKGHWLEITPEMAEARLKTVKCGYCGHQHGPYHTPAPGPFCEACLDSPYLKETDLHLLRLVPLAEKIESVFHYDKSERAPLSDDERATLLPLYVDRQTTGNDSRAVAKKQKERDDVMKKFTSHTANEKVEMEGMIWLLDRGFSTDNVIYYSHTGKFSFGWRSPVGPSVVSKLLDVISEFPFAYEIKCEDGRTLSAE